MHVWGHLCTITKHKIVVMEHCFRCGLYWQGLTHDLSKYAPSEFWVGAKYYQGTQSPNNAERKDRGYSSAWLHHKGRNKHHIEYWIDYSLEPGVKMDGCKMPEKYVYEMFCDRVAATKIYNGKNYRPEMVWEYYEHSKDHYYLHPETAKLLEKLIQMMIEHGELYTFAYIRKRRKKASEYERETVS